MLVAALAAPASAHPLEWHVEGTGEALPEAPALDLRAHADGRHDGYVGVASRFAPDGTWLGRAGVGIDLFGGGDGLDLRLGLFLGGVGNAGEPSMVARGSAGGEVEVALELGRVRGSYRHADGFAGVLEDRLTEDELRLGFRITDTWRVHGNFVVLNPGDDQPRDGFGLGVEAIF